MKLFRIALLAILFQGCDDQSKVIDPFPIEVDQSVGPVLLAASANADAPNQIVVDVLSPITVLDSFRPGGEILPPRRRLSSVTLYGLENGQIGVPRVRFSESAAFDLHPCENLSFPTNCKVGLDVETREIFGILGADILSRTSVRFDFPKSQLRFFPDAAGTEAERTLACDAVFASPYGGGGTILIGGSEIRYGGHRPTLGVCVHHESIAEPSLESSEVGTSLQMAISTAIGPTLLSEDAYQRYVDASGGTAAKISELPIQTIHTVSGPIEARIGQVEFWAFTGVAGDDSDGRGPCRELYANARMRTPRSCAERQVDCPCPSGKRSCKAAAAVEINRAIRVAIVPSTLELLQGLRDELRPSVPELDGIVGTEALADLLVEFDFPNRRLIMRCQKLGECTTRPQVRSQVNLPFLDTCREREDQLRQAMAPDAGVIP